MEPDRNETETGPRSAGLRGLRDEEPFATIRAFPRRFGWGIPLVFLVSIAAGVTLAGRSLSAAIALQLLVQTVGLLWLYIPALRRRTSGRAPDRHGGARSDPGAEEG